VIVEAVFAPVQSTTAFEETLERLGTAIKLGLLPPGTRLPPERDLCEQLGIARSTLRQALTALVQSGHLHAVRGRGGGTFVADAPIEVASRSELVDWRDRCDVRFAVECGVAFLAAERADAAAIALLSDLVDEMAASGDDFAAYRRADVRFHVGLAEATGSTALVAATTEAQGAMTDLISYIAHPPEVLAWSNAQHARLLDCLQKRDPALAMRVMADHLRGTEHVLAGLLP
jgi:GntR family transcriptional regulator, transcriptional repressor for pyruvate dehydrogenase complex